MYLTCAVTGSVASFVFSPPYPFAVGASGAIFGLFGVLLIASRVHHPVLARRERAIMTQVGTLIVLNLAIGFGLGGVDRHRQRGPRRRAPRRAVARASSSCRPTRRRCPRCGRAPTGRAVGWRPSAALQVAGVAVLVGVVAVGIVVGDANQRGGAAGPSGRRRRRAARGVGSPEAAERQADRRGTRGMTTLTRAPCGATCSAMALPPWASASSRTMASPRPLPEPEREGSPR